MAAAGLDYHSCSGGDRRCVGIHRSRNRGFLKVGSRCTMVAFSPGSSGEPLFENRQTLGYLQHQSRWLASSQ